MGTIANKLNRIIDTKNDIKDAINISTPSKITAETTFQEYPKQILEEYVKTINNGTDGIYNNFPKTTSESSDALLDTRRGPIKIELKGNDIIQKNNLLPIEYTQVDYIECDAHQYILTDYILTPNSCIEMDAQVTNTTVQKRLFGTSSGATDDLCASMYINGSGKFAWSCKNDAADWNATAVTADTNRHIFKLDIFNRKVWVDSSSKNITAITTNNSKKPLVLFTYYTGGNINTGYYAYLKTYSVKIYESNVLVANFMPCYRTSDSVVGLYETISGKFYSSKTSSNLLYNENMVLPTPEYVQDIHTTSGDNTISIRSQNLYNVHDRTSEPDYSVVDENDFTTLTINNDTSARKYAADYVHASSYLQPNRDYWLVIEVEEVSGTGDIIFVSNAEASGIGQFTTYVKYSLSNLSNHQLIKTKLRTRSSFDNCNVFFRKNGIFEPGQSGTIKYRMSLLEEEPDLDTFTYEKYQEQNYMISLNSENLFDIDNPNILNGYIEDNNLVLDESNNNRILYIPCLPSSFYEISRTVKTNSFKVGIYNEEEMPTQTEESTSYSINHQTVDDDAYKIYLKTVSTSRFIIVQYGNVIDDTNIQDSLESINIIQSIECCKIGSYKDFFFRNTTSSPYYNNTLLENEWYLKKETWKHIFYGNDNDNYAVSKDNTNTIAVNIKPYKVEQPSIRTTTNAKMYCDKFGYNGTVNDFEHIYLTQAEAITEGWKSAIRLYINHSRLNGYSSELTNTEKAALVKNWIKDNHLITYYIKITPSYFHISQQDYPTLKSQLDTLEQNIKSYENKTSITAQGTGDNLPLLMNVIALEK